jgi:hypothetical protein
MNRRSNAESIALTKAQLKNLLSHADSTSGSARQEHGFVFQSAAANLMGLYVPQGYTHKWDAYDNNPESSPTSPCYSFKNVSYSNNIELGSLKRQASLDTDFYLCVALWRENKLNIERIYFMHVKAAYWQSLWPDDVTPFLEQSVFHNISNSRADDANWSQRRSELSSAWEKALPPGSPIKWHAKRDHGSQRRIQCSIGKEGFEQFFADTFDPAKTRLLQDLLESGKRLR